MTRRPLNLLLALSPLLLLAPLTSCARGPAAKPIRPRQTALPQGPHNPVAIAPSTTRPASQPHYADALVKEKLAQSYADALVRHLQRPTPQPLALGVAELPDYEKIRELARLYRLSDDIDAFRMSVAEKLPRLPLRESRTWGRGGERGSIIEVPVSADGSQTQVGPCVLIRYNPTSRRLQSFGVQGLERTRVRLLD